MDISYKTIFEDPTYSVIICERYNIVAYIHYIRSHSCKLPSHGFLRLANSIWPQSQKCFIFDVLKIVEYPSCQIACRHHDVLFYIFCRPQWFGGLLKLEMN